MVQHRHEDAIRRLLREYLALPGLALTPRQIKRLLSLNEDVWQEVLTALVDTGYVIHRSADGRCVRPPGVDLGDWRRAVQDLLNRTRKREAPCAVLTTWALEASRTRQPMRSDDVETAVASI